MLCTFDFDVVTAVCQLLINGYVMLCYMHVVAYSNTVVYTCIRVYVGLKLTAYNEFFGDPAWSRLHN